MFQSPCYVFSDAHIGHASRDVERAVVGFLRAMPGRAASVLINGDLFEFWFEWRNVVPRSGVRVLAALADIVDAGVPVTMLAGNHDCWGGEVLRDDAGVDYRVEPWRGSLAGWRAYVHHGDGLRGRPDRGYRGIRPILRNQLAIRMFRWLHPDTAHRLALGSSHASRSYAPRDGGEGLRDAARRHLEAHEEDELVVYGHSHVARLERVPSGGVYANPGSWLDRPTYLCITPERIELREWDASASAEGPCLHALDRTP